MTNRIASTLHRVYYGSFSDYDQMMREFRVEPKDGPGAESMLFAAYEGGAYEGDATVVFRVGDSIFLVEAGHCSCYGLEEQWKPDETTAEALAAMDLSTYAYEKETIDAFNALFKSQG